MSSSVRIERVTKKFGEFKAVDDVSLEIEEGEFFTLLGPSGCGKTTLLRMIIGFHAIDEGSILFGEKRMNSIPPHRRNIGMVFQNYAIFPHLTVAENIAYGLKARKVDRAEQSARVEEALRLMKLSDYAERSPAQLSGGQQQRVALARAIVIKPSILLMDEPLSNLDAKLRIEMRSVIRDIQQSLGITTIYVTHDQDEALAISDRIAVMNAGRVQQVGRPREIYSRPRNTFVASFIGTTNFLKASVIASDETSVQLKVLDGGIIRLPQRRARVGDSLSLAVRPEEASLVGANDGTTVNGIITKATFLGDTMNYIIELPNGASLDVNEYATAADSLHKCGDRVGLRFDEKKVNIFASASGEALA